MTLYKTNTFQLKSRLEHFYQRLMVGWSTLSYRSINLIGIDISIGSPRI